MFILGESLGYLAINCWCCGYSHTDVDKWVLLSGPHWNISSVFGLPWKFVRSCFLDYFSKWPWRSPGFPSDATMRLIFVLSKTFYQVSYGLPWHLKQIFMVVVMGETKLLLSVLNSLSPPPPVLVRVKLTGYSNMLQLQQNFVIWCQQPVLFALQNDIMPVAVKHHHSKVIRRLW